jgi:hypothetical protein
LKNYETFVGVRLAGSPESSADVELLVEMHSHLRSGHP